MSHSSDGESSSERRRGGGAGKVPRRGKPGSQNLAPGFFVLWLTLSVLMVWNIFVLWPSVKPEAKIPYSTFLSQVRAGNVSKVHIVGADITGTFVEPLVWPQPKAKKEEAPPPEKPGSPGTGKSSQPPPPAGRYGDFRTTFPAAVGDSGLMPLLESRHVVVEVSSPSTPWLSELLLNWLPLLVLVGLFWWMGRRALGGPAELFGRGGAKPRRYTGDRERVTFDDVAGADEAKADLKEEVDFLRHPEKYHEIGARIPKGVLLVGPPGTGKTLLARAVAGEAGVPFFSLSASEFVEMFVGVGARRVRDLFRDAKAAAPAIVFIDELDAVGRRRGAGVGTVNDEREQTLNQLLGELDGFDERAEVIVLSATNRPDVLDPALLRPGRFDRQVVIGLPDRKGREAILRIHSRKLRLSADVELPVLARATIGMSGADLANLCNEAALEAARKSRGEIGMVDFEAAQDKVRLGAAGPQLADPEERRVVACHEAGHALVAWLTPAADEVRKVTIVPHGQALGLTEQLPGEDRHNYGESYLAARLAVMLGGRSAEEVVFGEATTGAENDLVEATRLARRMVSRWGMGSLGLVAFKTDERQPFLGYEMSQGRDYSEATAARIDEDVVRLLDQTHEAVRRLLEEARARLERLIEALLQEETVESDELRRILGPRAEPKPEKSAAGPEPTGEIAEKRAAITSSR